MSLATFGKKGGEGEVILPLIEYDGLERAVDQGEGGESDEKIYADWDCPEVEIVSDYSAEVNNSLETNHPDPLGGGDTAGNDYLDVKSGERMKVMRKLTSSGIFRKTAP